VYSKGITRKEFLGGAIAAGVSAVPVFPEAAHRTSEAGSAESRVATAGIYNVRTFGAVGDGKTIDSPAINKAIQAANDAGGGTVYVPAGNYLCYSIRLKSSLTLYLDSGATIVAADVPLEGTTSGGYDPAEGAQPWDGYQDYGHSHWHNSLLWGEDLHDVSILGPGRIWGKGLSRGQANELPLAESPGVANKAIALRNCRNVILRDFSVLKGGHFAVLLTGVDNAAIDGLKIDSNRDGIDIDCCKNVRVSNCTVNAPWDDAICLKSSFALGYARATENVTIANCYVTGIYDYGTLLDGTFKRMQYPPTSRPPVGRIKCGTESNGGFKNIAVSNCSFEGCRKFALETVDGGRIEDVTVCNITMRDLVHAPIFLRLGARLRGPKGVQPGVLKRVILSNIVSSNAAAQCPSIISGIPGSMIEDIKISDVYLQHKGGGTKNWAELKPEEMIDGYPEATMFGTLPAQGFFIRHARNVEFTNVEIAAIAQDDRPAFWMRDMDGVDLFRIKTGARSPGFALTDVKRFRNFGSRDLVDKTEDSIDSLKF